MSMVPTVSRRPIPKPLLPAEVTDAQAQLSYLQRRAMTFWVMVLPMTITLWIILGAVGVGLFAQLMLTLFGMGGMAAGRLAWRLQERPQRRHARATIDRWRRMPGDRRWDAAMILLERISRLGEHDPALQETARRVVSVLFSLYEDIRGLDRSIAADRVLDGEGELSDRYHRLLAIRKRREAQIDALLNGLRDLHLEMNEQLAEQLGPLQDRLQELMDRLDADRETARIGGIRRRVLQQQH
ncbi:MAG: hypothetical protein AAFV53_21280 [Myxococcota bacterium]